MPVLELANTMCAPLIVAPALSFAVAVSCAVAPTSIVLSFAVSATDATGFGVGPGPELSEEEQAATIAMETNAEQRIRTCIPAPRRE
jgi:hypothetical protein